MLSSEMTMWGSFPNTKAALNSQMFEGSFVNSDPDALYVRQPMCNQCLFGLTHTHNDVYLWVISSHIFSHIVVLLGWKSKSRASCKPKLSLCLSKAPSLGSQGTQDSGLGLQYLSSPDRGRHQDSPPTGGGYWVYVPPTHTWMDSQGGSDADRSSRGQTPSPPPPAPAAAVSAGLSDCQTPLVGPAWLLCGSPAAVVYSPPAGGAALLCNIPEHRDTVSVHSLNLLFYYDNSWETLHR